MIRQVKSIAFLSMISFVVVASSCSETEDPGPLQEDKKTYTIVDFDRLEMGSEFHIQVEQSNSYSVTVEGDRRNLNDIDLYKEGSTLIVKYDNNEDRKHDTYITIRMPSLVSAHFSGASSSVIDGFESDEHVDLFLSGASILQMDAGYREVNFNLSGASHLRLYGLGDEINGELTGASKLTAFEYPVRKADIGASGASIAKITVTDELDVVASGGSDVSYRGNPVITKDVSGGSNVEQD